MENIENRDIEKNSEKRFRITLSGYVLNTAIRIIKPLVDMVKFKYTNEGLAITVIDPAHVNMIDMLIERDGLMEYDIEEDTTFSIDLDNIPKINDNDTVSISRQNGILKIEYSNITKQVEELDSDYIGDVRIPKLSTGNKYEIYTKPVRNFVNEANKITDSIRITAGLDKMILKAVKDDNNKMEMTLVNDMDYHVINTQYDSITCAYPLEYLYKFMKNLKLVNDITLTYMTDYPMSIEAKFPVAKDKNAMDVIDVRFMLAPRMEH